MWGAGGVQERVAAEHGPEDHPDGRGAVATDGNNRDERTRRRGGWGVYWGVNDPRSQGGRVLGAGRTAQQAEVDAAARPLTMVRGRVTMIADSTMLQRELTTPLRGRAARIRRVPGRLGVWALGACAGSSLPSRAGALPSDCRSWACLSGGTRRRGASPPSGSRRSPTSHVAASEGCGGSGQAAKHLHKHVRG